MKVTDTPLEGVKLIELQQYHDDRGYFMETHHAGRFSQAGLDLVFLQDNHSFSRRGVLRGLHFQEPNAQGKLVRCVRGAIYDVAVDIRKDSPRFGKWFGVELTDENRLELWVPPGFAHGFCALTEMAEVIYKCTALYDPAAERSILWNDPDIGIQWPLDSPLLSPKDASAPRLEDAPLLPLMSRDQGRSSPQLSSLDSLARSY